MCDNGTSKALTELFPSLESAWRGFIPDIPTIPKEICFLAGPLMRQRKSPFDPPLTLSGPVDADRLKVVVFALEICNSIDKTLKIKHPVSAGPLSVLYVSLVAGICLGRILRWFLR
jgi:hypothetical protein